MPGYHISLDGVDDYVSVPNNATLDLTNNFKISLTFAPKDLASAGQYLLSKGVNRYAIIWEYVNNTVEFYCDVNFSGTNPRTGSGIVLPDANKHTITYEYDGITWKGSLDAVQVFSVARTFSLSGTGALYITAASPTTGFFSGALYDLAIWKSAVLSGQWIFDVGSGTTITDGSGNSNTATLNGGVTWVADAPAGGVTHPGSATMQGASLATATATQTQAASATANGVASTSISASLIQSASSAMQGIGAASATGVQIQTASSSIQGVSVASATATLTQSANMSAQGVANVTADASQTTKGSTTMQGVGTMAVSAGGVQPGSATMGGVATMSANGTLVQASSASIQGVSTMSATSVLTVRANVTMGGVGALTVSSTLTTKAAVTMQGVAQMLLLTGTAIVRRVSIQGSANRIAINGEIPVKPPTQRATIGGGV